jgi:hypothetical protein
MICQICGIEAKTKHVEFHQNIGALVLRFHKSIKGEMCKSCIHKNFWQFTLITVAVGWLGVISFFLAPIFALNNIVRYLLCLPMQPVPALAKRPELTEQALAALRPQTQAIAQRMNAGESLEKIAADISYTCGVTPGQVVLYVRALLAAARK